MNGRRIINNLGSTDDTVLLAERELKFQDLVWDDK